MSVRNVTATQPIIVEIFKSGLRLCTDISICSKNAAVCVTLSKNTVAECVFLPANCICVLRCVVLH